MKVKAKVKNKVDTKKVKEKKKKAEFKSIEAAGGYIRQAILDSLGKGTPSKAKKTEGQRLPSKPGKPPKHWGNVNKNTYKSMAYGSGGKRRSRYIGFDIIRDASGRATGRWYASPRESNDRIFQMHEKGGTQPVRAYKAIVKDRTYRRNRESHGWNYKNWSGHRPMEERSESERKYIRAYYKNVRKLKKTTKTARYPARPFMMPAVTKCLPRIPKIWQSSFHRYFR